MVTLQQVTRIRAPIGRVFDLARSVEVHVLGNTHFGEQAVALAGTTLGLLELGDLVTWQARHFGVRQLLTSAITRFDPPHAFQDTMLRGAFASMQHDHFFRSWPNGLTVMRDVFRFSAPIPVLGLIAEQLVLRNYMCALLEERNEVIRKLAESESWRLYVHR